MGNDTGDERPAPAALAAASAWQVDTARPLYVVHETDEAEGEDGATQLEGLLDEVNARPREPAELRQAVALILELRRLHPESISEGEAAWAVARLTRGALPLPATPDASDMSAFARATACLVTPVKQARQEGRISRSELRMASDHLQRQIFERLAKSPAALLGAALAEVRAQLGKPR